MNDHICLSISKDWTSSDIAVPNNVIKAGQKEWCRELKILRYLPRPHRLKVIVDSPPLSHPHSPNSLRVDIVPVYLKESNLILQLNIRI